MVTLQMSDLIQFGGMLLGFVTLYVGIDRRLTRVETYLGVMMGHNKREADIKSGGD